MTAPAQDPALDNFRAIADAIAMGVAGLDATYIHDGASKYPRPVRLRLPTQDQASLDGLLAVKVRSTHGALVPLSELMTVQRGGFAQLSILEGHPAYLMHLESPGEA